VFFIFIFQGPEKLKIVYAHMIRMSPKYIKLAANFSEINSMAIKEKLYIHIILKVFINQLIYKNH
jgi:hypothetical protein